MIEVLRKRVEERKNILLYTLRRDQTKPEQHSSSGNFVALLIAKQPVTQFLIGRCL